MTDRLRKLDGLFAEKVLGREVQGACSATVDWWEIEAPDGRIHEHRTQQLRSYTRSLDAAWEGTSSGDFCCRRIYSDYNYVHEARVSKHSNDQEHPPHHATFTGQSVDHPAEALVLACLRAVGVSEDELTI